MLADSDLIITMQSGQREAILTEFPSIDGRVLLLSEIAIGVAYDIPDLFDENDGSYQELGDEVCKLVETGYKAICQQAMKFSNETHSG